MLLDRYIARQYLTNIAALFVLLFAIIIVIDFSLNFDEYVKIAGVMHKDTAANTAVNNGATAVFLVFDLWWPRLFLLFNFLLGLVLVGAMGFTCAQLNRHREFVAILSGGLSLHRVARPILAVAVGLTTLAALNREMVIPKLAPLLTRDKQDAGKSTMGANRQPLCADASGRLFYAKSVNLDDGTIDGLWVWERDSDGLMTRRITAAHATFSHGHWQLDHGLAENHQAQGTTRVFEPVTTLETDLDPTALRLRRFEGYSNNLSSGQLTELLANYRQQPEPVESRIDRLERIRFGRFAGYACNILILLICLPFYLRREPGNMLVQSLMAAPSTMLSFVAALVGTSAAIPGLPAQLSVFVPVMILIPLAIAAVSSIRT